MMNGRQKMPIEIIQGDCLEVMKTFADNQFDLVLTDPPYGIDYGYLTYKDTRENLIDLIRCFVPEVLRISKRAIIFPGIQNVCLYPQSDWLMSYSWDTTATYGKMGYNQWQPLLFYGDDVRGFGNVNGILKSDSIKLSGGGTIGFLSEFPKGKHPCPKPRRIIQILINRLSAEGDEVLDPFLGSGTTAVICESMGRNCVGIEISEKYCETARKRVAAEKAKMALFAGVNK